jgi:hypothetical protein
VLHTTIIPRLPFAVMPIAGIPGVPLQPIPVRTDCDGLGHTWAVCYAHLLALHALYGVIDVRRPMGRLHDLTTSIHPVVHCLAGLSTARGALASAREAVHAIDSEVNVLGLGHEAGWWVVALQSSLAIGVWYELSPGADQAAADFASGVATGIRRILGSVFDPRAVAAIQASSHGDGAGDLLAQVAANAMALGAPLQGMPSVGEIA